MAVAFEVEGYISAVPRGGGCGRDFRVVASFVYFFLILFSVVFCCAF